MQWTDPWNGYYTTCQITEKSLQGKTAGCFCQLFTSPGSFLHFVGSEGEPPTSHPPHRRRPDFDHCRSLAGTLRNTGCAVKFSAARTTFCARISVYHSPWVVINSWLALLILFAIWKGRPQHINQKVEHPKIQKAWMNWNCTLTPSTCIYIIAGACSFIAAMPRYRSLHQLFRATTAEGTFWDTLLTMSCC